MNENTQTPEMREWTVCILNGGEIEVIPTDNYYGQGTYVGKVEGVWYWIAYSLALDMVEHTAYQALS
jgi:hypothetical protein